LNKLLTILAMLCLHAVSATANNGVSTKTEVVVMVYMNAKNDLDCDAVADVREMASAMPLANMKVIIELGRFPSGNGCSKEDKTDIWSGTLFFQITKNLIPTPRQALLNAPEKLTIPGYGADVDMGAPQSLRKFVIWTEKWYPAEHYILVIWGHGRGYRLTNKYRPTDVALSEDQCHPAPLKSGYRVVSVDDCYQSYLYTHDFREALAGTKKLDVLAFDSCLMSGIETAYAVRKFSTVMVASEDLEPDGGWNYKNVLYRLSNVINKTPFSLGASIVDAARYDISNSTKITTLSAIDLSKVNAVAKSISQFSDAMIAALQRGKEDKKIRSQIADARSKCRNYGEQDGFHNPIDLVYFLKMLVSEHTNSEIHRAAQKLLESIHLSRIVFDNYAIRLDSNFDSYGITIYFPENKESYNHDPDDHGDGYSKYICSIPGKHPVDFVCELNWSSFLDVYFPQAHKELSAANRCRSHLT
jgi:hypothetical protein